MRSIRPHRSRPWLPGASVTLLALSWFGALVAPPTTTAFTAVQCAAEGPIVATRVVAGGLISIWGSYTDWADPGTVVATFRGPGGRTRTATAGNSADGTYWIDERFTAADIGAWTASVSMSETAGSVVCTDRFLVTLRAPSTDTLPGDGPHLPLLAALAAVGSLGGAIALARTRRRVGGA